MLFPFSAWLLPVFARTSTTRARRPLIDSKRTSISQEGHDPRCSESSAIPSKKATGRTRKNDFSYARVALFRLARRIDFICYMQNNLNRVFFNSKLHSWPNTSR